MQGDTGRQDVLQKLQEEFSGLREECPDLLSLDSQEVREAQVAKTEERISIVQGLRSDSLARSTTKRVGAPNSGFEPEDATAAKLDREFGIVDGMPTRGVPTSVTVTGTVARTKDRVRVVENLRNRSGSIRFF